MTTFNKLFSFGRQDVQMALIVTRREVRDSFRDWRIIIPIIILTLVFPGLANFTAAQLLRFTEQFGAELISERLIPFLLLVVGFFPMSFSLVIALETFVGEKERKSLEPLLATPLTNTQLYMGKMLAAIIPPMSTSYLGIAVYLIGLMITIGWVVPADLFVQIILLSTIQGVIMVAGAVIVSSQTTSVRAANLLASFIIVPIALLLQFEAIVMFWGNNEGLWWLIVALLVTAVILVRMGVKIFNREELLGRDIDQLRLKWIISLGWDRFSGRSSTGRYPHLIEWYRETLAILKTLRQPVVLLLIALVGAVALGVSLTQVYSLPPAIQSNLSSEIMADNISNIGILLSRLSPLIFFQNVRVLALMALLGIFTLGVSDVLIFVLPWALIGFLGGQLSLAGENPFTFFAVAILPHATVELPALLLGTAAILRWHTTVMAPPPDRTVSESWLLGAADFGRILVGLVIPLLIISALIEAHITPNILSQVYGGG
jgi:uncharacterized membrane protein SpoIIM required for sporulation/ABC-type transport system involved in multi-copper enzyme maturation permease subunit